MKLIKIIAQFSMLRIFIAAIALSAGYFFMYYDNGTAFEAQITAINDQIATEVAKKKDTEKTIKREDEMRANLAALARDLQVVKAKLPNEFKDTEMTAMVNKAAQSAGLNITSLNRKKSAPALSSTASGADSVEEIVFDLALNGKFNQFVQFLDILSKEEKIIKIRDFVIEKNSKNPDDFLIRFKGDIIGFKQAQVVAK